MRPMLPAGAHECQIGTFDADFPRIRYAVPSLIYTADSCSIRANSAVCAVGKHPYPHPYVKRLVRAQLARGDVVGASTNSGKTASSVGDQRRLGAMSDRASGPPVVERMTSFHDRSRRPIFDRSGGGHPRPWGGPTVLVHDRDDHRFRVHHGGQTAQASSQALPRPSRPWWTPPPHRGARRAWSAPARCRTLGRC